MPRLVEATNEDPRLDLDLAEAERLFQVLDTIELPWKIPPGDLGVAFVAEASCRQLHADFFDDDSVTDVMTFPGDPEDEHAGDLAVCPAHAARQAPVFGEDFATELTLYLVHGWLHLAGLDDRSPETVAAMRAAEVQVIEKLREAGSLLKARWRE